VRIFTCSKRMVMRTFCKALLRQDKYFVQGILLAEAW
jgi:hypothetical protein